MPKTGTISYAADWNFPGFPAAFLRVVDFNRRKNPRQLCGGVFQYAVQHNQNVMCGFDGKLVLKQQFTGKVIRNSRSHSHRKAAAELRLDMLFQNRVILDVGGFSYFAFRKRSHSSQ